MAKVNVYLNFNGNCEEAFLFYASVFKTENTGIYRYGEIPNEPDMSPMSEEDKAKVMHTSLTLNDSTMLMGADVVEGFGGKLNFGNNTYIMLDVDTPEEAQQYFDALSKDAQQIEMSLEETFFAERFASIQDHFGIYWMIHFEGNKTMGH